MGWNPLKVLSDKIDEQSGKIDLHIQADDHQFGMVLDALKKHDTNTAQRHEDNQRFNREITAAIGELKGSIGTIDSLMPAIKAGIEADQKIIYRRKLIGRVVWTVISTLVTLSALIPLMQAVAGLRIAVHFVG